RNSRPEALMKNAAPSRVTFGAGGLCFLAVLLSVCMGPNCGTSGTTTLPTAVIVMNFSDSPNQPFDMKTLIALYNGSPGAGVASYFEEVSFGKTAFAPTLFGPYTSPATGSSVCTDINAIRTQALQMANSDANFLNFKRLVYVVDCGVGEGGN